MDTRELNEDARADANVVGVNEPVASECEGEWPPEVALEPPRGERPPEVALLIPPNEEELQEALVAVALRV